MRQYFDLVDLNDIMVGAHLYASGGGCALENGQQLINQIIKLYPKDAVKVPLISPKDIKSDEYVAVSAAMGAPQSFLELGFGKSPVRAFQAHQSSMVRLLKDPTFKFSGIVPVETGVMAHSMCLLVAAILDIPIVDGDGGGRAFPLLQMATFARPIEHHPIPVSPAILCSEEDIAQQGTTISFEQNEASTVDKLTRAIISCNVGFKNRASLSCFAMDGAALRVPGRLVWNTLTRAKTVGSALRQAIAQKSKPVDTVLSLTHGVKLFEGELHDVANATMGGFDTLTITLKRGKDAVVIVAKNENMLVWSNDRSAPLAMAPDIIAYMTPEGQVLGNSEITELFKKGQRPMVSLLGIPADKEIINDYFIQQFQSVFQQHGYYGAYVPLKA